MHEQRSHIWAIGLDDRGAPTICGPYGNEQDADQATAHLHSVRFYPMTSSNRAVVIPQLRRIARSKAFRAHSEPHTDAPMDNATKRSIMDRVIGRNKRPDKDEQDLDDE